MVSELAVEKIEQMREEGLEPTVRDIIRLNGLGLRMEAEKQRRASSCLYYLPRVAAISPSVSFRQPTIGHDVWLDRIERIVDHADFETTLAIKAFALSRPADKLPDPEDPKSVTEAIRAYCEELKDFTQDQIFAAINYAMYGAESDACEFAECSSENREPDGYDERDWDCCVSAGVMRKAQVYLTGMSVADIGKMTTEQVQAAMRAAYKMYGLEEADGVRYSEVEFYRTFDAIRERLQNGKGVKNG